jgi:hypothetical protein
MFGQGERKVRSDRFYTVPGYRFRARWVPVEMIGWLEKIASALGIDDPQAGASLAAYRIAHMQREDWIVRKKRYKLSDQWAKYQYNGHRRISIYVDVPLGEWIEELCEQQHRSLNYTIVSILREAHTRYLEDGTLPVFDRLEQQEG